MIPNKQIAFGLVLFIFISVKTQAQITKPVVGGSQKSTVCQWMGVAEVCVSYSSPNVVSPSGKSRRGEIWGKMVPYGFSQERWMEDEGEPSTPKPWRAGANENTVVTFSHDVTIEGKTLSAGAYGVFFIPGEEEWELILSNDSKNWGHYFYDEKNDALRVKVIPEQSEYHQWLTYEFTDKKLDSTILTLFWEDLKVPVHIGLVDINKAYINQIKEDLSSKKILYWYNWHDAARYCLDNNIELELGLYWAEKAIDQTWVGNPNFITLRTKAEILRAMKRTKEADSFMQFTIQYAGSVFDLHNYGRELLAKNKVQEALDIFKINARKHPDYWLSQFGLARGYAATGDFKSALKYAQAAKKIIPKEELSARQDALSYFIIQVEKKEPPIIYFAPGLHQVY